jgi:shikimate dehydrogenase
MSIHASTQICMVIGDPIRHSLSPAMHNAAYQVADIDDLFVFVAARVIPEELEDAVKGFRSLKIAGISVTLPHKQSVLPFLDKLDPSAEKIGAVNTIVNHGGELTGYNTDADGITGPIGERTNIENSRAVVIGAGGAARAAAFGLAAHGASITILNRTKKRGQALASDVGGAFLEIERATELQAFDIIVNTTPVGMTPEIDRTPVVKEIFRPEQVVMDAIYNPRETRFLREAKEAGSQVIDGIEMFVAQGARQFQLYTEREAPVTVMESVVLEHLGK